MWNGVAVIAQIVLVGVLDAPVRGLELNEYQRDTVDKADEIGPAGVHLAGDPELRHQKKVVLLGTIPIDQMHDFRTVTAGFRVGYFDTHALFDQVVDLAIGLGQAHGAAVAGELFDGQVKSFRRQVGIEFLQHWEQAGGQHHFGFGFTTERAAAGLFEFTKTVVGFPP